MQRQLPEGIVIACDFCGTDWDEVIPMIEGHKGSILCLDCLKTALENTTPATAEFHCTLCVYDKPAETPSWIPENPPPTANPKAAVCKDCLSQAAGTFSKDPDTDWKKPAP